MTLQYALPPAEATCPIAFESGPPCCMLMSTFLFDWPQSSNCFGVSTAEPAAAAATVTATVTTPTAEPLNTK